jgi:hypothetical protein
MAGLWKTIFILVLATGVAVRAQGGVSVSPPSFSRIQSSPPSQAAATPSSIPSAAGPQLRPDQDGPPPVAAGLPGVGFPGSNGQGAVPASQGMSPRPGGQGGMGGPGAPGQNGTGMRGMEGMEGMGGGAPGGKPKSPFIYMPSFSMAVAAAVGYAVISFITLVQCFKHKTWFFLLVPQAALADLVGAVARSHAVLHPKAMIFFIIQQMTFGMIPSLLGIMTIMTFTRVIWWITPDDNRNKSTLKSPPHAISLLWAGVSVIPDMIKGVASFLGKPKGEMKEMKPDVKPDPKDMPNPGSLYNRMQSICLIVQFFVFLCWTLWALRFMLMSRRWLMSGEVIEKRGRRLGWVCVAVGVLISVCHPAARLLRI